MDMYWSKVYKNKIVALCQMFLPHLSWNHMLELGFIAMSSFQAWLKRNPVLLEWGGSGREWNSIKCALVLRVGNRSLLKTVSIWIFLYFEWNLLSNYLGGINGYCFEWSYSERECDKNRQWVTTQFLLGHRLGQARLGYVHWALNNLLFGGSTAASQ